MQLNDYEIRHNEIVRKYAAECALFLKRDETFPLSETCEIALYGSGARHTIRGGTGSGEVNSRYTVTMEEGLKNAGFTVTTKAWLDGYDKVIEKAHEEFVRNIRANARKHHTSLFMEGFGAVMNEPAYDLPLDGKGDVAIYVLSRISGEGNDRAPEAGDILLSETEQRDILALQTKYKKFLLVLNTGGPVDLSPVHYVKNILLFSQLGNQAGDIFADILLGKSNPSGKLATTWAEWSDYQTIGDFGDEDDTFYTEGIYVGYRYFDTVKKKAAFPFGFGLSYTSFESIKKEVSVEGTKVTVKETLKNTGEFAGKEVLQVYVSVPEGKLDQPYQTLAAFKKTQEVPAGGETTVEASFDLTEIASYDTEAAAYILEAGDYIIRAGHVSTETEVVGLVRLDKTVNLRQVKNLYGDCGFKDWTSEKNEAEEISKKIPVFKVSEKLFKTEETLYDPEYPVDSEISALTDEELMYMNIGHYDEKGGILSVVGDASMHVAGAAGEFTNKLQDKGIKTLITADGPCGLRISPKYVIRNGRATSIDAVLPSVVYYYPKLVTKTLDLLSPRAKKGEKVYEQYTTMIPIGTAIAQSWNTDMAEVFGNIVGDEMQRFNVHLWLAPAMNIHRSIRCGRNFEYYSEDPLITGRIAAAITKGVQSHKGCGVTIKHYCANNQEYDRYGNNSHVSERAMREIYLRGFAICVREAQPESVMTSYNLLNGVHTSESRELLEDTLRAEYGFKGIVMTDWVIPGITEPLGKYERPHAYGIAAAGGDVMMPGSPSDFADMKRGLAEGKITREQLEINATRMLRMIRKLNA